MSDSQSNARAQQATSRVKRGLSQSVSQPDPKRKTLSEKVATEFPGRSNSAGSSSVSAPRGHVKGYSLKDVVSLALDVLGHVRMHVALYRV